MMQNVSICLTALLVCTLNIQAVWIHNGQVIPSEQVTYTPVKRVAFQSQIVQVPAQFSQFNQLSVVNDPIRLQHAQFRAQRRQWRAMFPNLDLPYDLRSDNLSYISDSAESQYYADLDRQGQDNARLNQVVKQKYDNDRKLQVALYRIKNLKEIDDLERGSALMQKRMNVDLNNLETVSFDKVQMAKFTPHSNPSTGIVYVKTIDPTTKKMGTPFLKVDGSQKTFLAEGDRVLFGMVSYTIAKIETSTTTESFKLPTDITKTLGWTNFKNQGFATKTAAYVPAKDVAINILNEAYDSDEDECMICMGGNSITPTNPLIRDMCTTPNCQGNICKACAQHIARDQAGVKHTQHQTSGKAAKKYFESSSKLEPLLYGEAPSSPTKISSSNPGKCPFCVQNFKKAVQMGNGRKENLLDNGSGLKVTAPYIVLIADEAASSYKIKGDFMGVIVDLSDYNKIGHGVKVGSLQEFNPDPWRASYDSKSANDQAVIRYDSYTKQVYISDNSSPTQKYGTYIQKANTDNNGFPLKYGYSIETPVDHDHVLMVKNTSK